MSTVIFMAPSRTGQRFGQMLLCRAQRRKTISRSASMIVGRWSAQPLHGWCGKGLRRSAGFLILRRAYLQAIFFAQKVG